MELRVLQYFLAAAREKGMLLRWREQEIVDLAGVPLIIARRQSVRNELENWFGQGKEKLHIVSTGNLSHHNQSIMVENGIGVALVMEFACNQDTLCLRPLDSEIESGCVLVWKIEKLIANYNK